MKDRKINWNNTYVEPAQKLAKFVENNFEDMSTELKTQILDEQKANIEKWKNNDQQIEEIKQLIKTEKKAQQIVKKKFQRFGWILLFVLTLSIAYWCVRSKFKALVECLKGFKRWVQEQKDKIANIIQNKISLMKMMTGGYSIKKIYSEYLKAIGAKCLQNGMVVPVAVSEMWKNGANNKVGLIYQPYIIKNKIYSLLQMEYLDTVMVTTSATATWTVTTYDADGKAQTRFVSRTAYHHEPTPVYNFGDCHLVTKSNFGWNFSLETVARKKRIFKSRKSQSVDGDIELENDDFNDEFILKPLGNLDELGNEVKARELFTVLAQQNCLEFKTIVPNFKLTKKGKVLLYSKTNNNLSSGFYGNNSLSYYYSGNHEEPLESIVDKFNNETGHELNELLTGMAGMSTVPNLANEDTNGNFENYRIKNFVNDTSDDCEVYNNQPKNMMLAVLGQLRHLDRFLANSNRTMEKFIPYETESAEQLSADLWIVPLRRFWYTTETLYDVQTVGDPSVGYRTVSVPYVRYYEHEERVYSLIKGPQAKVENETVIFDNTLNLSEEIINQTTKQLAERQVYYNLVDNDNLFVLGNTEKTFALELANILK
ncbi:hypothetical protein [Ureaplasma ceti]|uniref:DUF31 domain-containing protein n=1 Tax=Ureaplasma ceti TaxID=3119530 RepID=A0ABP9UCQ3_9BACT